MKKIEHFYSLLIIASLELMLCSFINISDEEMLNMGITEEQLLQLKEDVVSGQTGRIEFPVCHASIDVPSDFVFLDKEQSKTLLVTYWNNPESHISNLLGTLVPSVSTCFYQISVAYVLTYDNCGYIKDDDANSIDYSELLKQMQIETAEENKKLPEDQRGIIKNWAVPPHYNQLKHVLVWAKTFEVDKQETVNYDMRILGKDGLVSINAVIDPSLIEEVRTKESEIIQSLHFDQGHAYSDFNPSEDKVSDWTIGGLVAGGILAKTGVLSKIGIFLLKFWKLLAIGVAGVGAAIMKYIRRGKDEEENEYSDTV